MNKPGPVAAGALTGVVSASVILGPLLRPGFVLTYDMVFVPHPRLDAATLGLDGSVPRAVPTDALVGVLGTVLPGEVVQKLLLVLFPILLGAGVGRLARTRSAAVVSAVMAIWNPYVAERLLIGHWAYLLGWAVLPWVVWAATRLRDRTPRSMTVTGLWLCAAAACGATPGLLALGTALLVVAWPDPDRRTWSAAVSVAAMGLAANAIWLWPALTVADGIPADPNGVAAFAARPDTPLGLLPSLLTFGGVWNPAAVPAERSSVFLATLVLGVTVGVLGYGRRGLLGRRDLPAGALYAAGLVSLVLAAAGGINGLDRVVSAVVVDIPGGGLIRDGQKLITPFMLLTVVSAGEAVRRVRAHPGPDLRPVGVLATIALVALPVLSSLGLATQFGGRLSTTQYPDAWAAMRSTLAGEGNQRVVELPWNAYRRYAWNGDRILLNPGPRFWPYGSVVSDDLPLAGGDVRGESALAARIGAALDTSEPARLLGVLRSESVGLVLLDSSQGRSGLDAAMVRGYPVVAERGPLTLYRVPGVTHPALGVSPAPARSLVGLALSTLLLLGLAVTWGVRGSSALRAAGPLGDAHGGSSPATVPSSAGSARGESGEPGMRSHDEGAAVAVVPLIVALLVGLGLAVVGAVALVSSQSASSTAPGIEAPLVTYDAR